MGGNRSLSSRSVPLPPCRVRGHHGRVQPDAGHPVQRLVRDPHRRERAGLRPRVPPRPAHCGGEPALRPVPADGDLLQRPPRRRHRRDRPEQLPLVAHHPEIGDNPRPVRDRARQDSEHPAPVMTPQRRRQRLRQPRSQARPVRHLPQQRQSRMRHDPRTAPGNFQTPRPPCTVHLESAPRTRPDKDLDNPYRPSSGALFHSGAPLSHQTPMKRQG